MITIKEALQKFGNDSVDIIRSNMSRAGQNATGETSNSLESTVKNDRLQVSGAAHIYTLETGRKPRESSQTSDFSKKLEKWVKARNITDISVRSLQFLINKYGTKLWRKGGRTDIITPIFNQSRFDKLSNEVTNIAFNKTLNVIDKGIKNG